MAQRVFKQALFLDKSVHSVRASPAADSDLEFSVLVIHVSEK